MTTTRNEASEVFKKVTENNENTKVTKIGKHLKSVEANFEGWDYTFFFHDDVLTKIEEFNHREIIEVYVK